MQPTIENQIKNIYDELGKCKPKWLGSIAKPLKQDVIEKEFKLLSKLLKYDMPALVYVANDMEHPCNPSPICKRIGLLISRIGILSLIIISIFIGIPLYSNYHVLPVYSLVGRVIAIVVIIFLCVVALFNSRSEFKNRHLVFLIKQVLELKERNINDEQALRSLFQAQNEILNAARAKNIKGEKLIYLLKEAIRQKERRK